MFFRKNRQKKSVIDENIVKHSQDAYYDNEMEKLKKLEPLTLAQAIKIINESIERKFKNDDQGPKDSFKKYINEVINAMEDGKKSGYIDDLIIVNEDKVLLKKWPNYIASGLEFFKKLTEILNRARKTTELLKYWVKLIEETSIRPEQYESLVTLFDEKISKMEGGKKRRITRRKSKYQKRPQNKSRMSRKSKKSTINSCETFLITLCVIQLLLPIFQIFFPLRHDNPHRNPIRFLRFVCKTQALDLFCKHHKR